MDINISYTSNRWSCYYYTVHLTSDEDTFAVIWKQSQDKYDTHGNEQEVGVNGFHGFTCTWDEHPDRDEEWKVAEIGRIGEEKFRREYGCEFLVYDETLN